MDAADQYAFTVSRFLYRDALGLGPTIPASTSTSSSASKSSLLAATSAAPSLSSTSPRTLPPCQDEAYDLFRLRHNQWLNDRIMDTDFETLTEGAERSTKQSTEHSTCLASTCDTSLPKKLSQLIFGGVKTIVIPLRGQEQRHRFGVLVDGMETSGSAKCYVYNSFGLSNPSSADLNTTRTNIARSEAGHKTAHTNIARCEADLTLLVRTALDQRSVEPLSLHEALPSLAASKTVNVGNRQQNSLLGGFLRIYL